MRQTLKISSIIIIAFGLFYFLNKNYFFITYDWLCNLIHLKIVAYFLAYVLVGLPLIIALFLIHKPKDITSSIGINKGFGKGLFFAFLCTLPMLIGYSVLFKFNIKITYNEIFTGVIFAAFFEELYFRGILFGQLFRYTRIGFILPVLICALIFAAGHLWQSFDFSVLIGIFVTTFLGAIFFAWTYIEWDNNLWVPMGLLDKTLTLTTLFRFCWPPYFLNNQQGEMVKLIRRRLGKVSVFFSLGQIYSIFMIL